MIPRWIRLLRLKWLHRHNSNHELRIMIDNLQMQARRCAYDLGHCSSSLDAELGHQNKRDCWEYGIFSERHRMWLDVFNPKGTKEYHSEQQREIYKLESEIERLRRHCKKHGIPDPEEIPF